MVKEVYEKKGVFSKRERNLLFTYVTTLVLLVGVIVAVFLWPTDAEANDIVEATPVKVVQPRSIAPSEPTALSVVVEVDAVEPAPYIVGDVLYDGYVYDALIKLYSDNNCTVIMGKPSGLEHAVHYTAGKSNCIVIDIDHM